MINVTKTYLPDFNKYTELIRQVYDSGWITNNGKLVQRLESELKEYLGVSNLFFCGNGTITLQIAIKCLEITKEVITTPFSYVATVNSIVWENCKPVFVDIDPKTFCIDPKKIEAAITPHTQAILATHVYGIACDIEALETISKKYSIPIIYDAAHGFGATFKGKSLLSFGDISSCSFHATKIFHTVEGGCLITDNKDLARKIYLARQFGHVYDDYFSAGINGKNSEFHAAMGLCMLPDVPEIINYRKGVAQQYDSLFSKVVAIERIEYPEHLVPNYGYYPIFLQSEGQLLKVKASLESQGINPRRYFYPSLNKLPFTNYGECPVAEDVSKRVLCLPQYFGLERADIERIASIIIQNL